jgi:hypothetical protein
MESIRRARHVSGGVDSNGREVTMPDAAYHAQLIDGIARRYSVLPSAVLKEDARILHYISIASEMSDDEAGGE